VLNQKKIIYATWLPRIGEKATKLRWQAFALYSWIFVLMIIWEPALVVGLRYNLTPVTVLGVCTLAAALILVVTMFVKSHQSKVATGLILGVKIGLGHAIEPPRTPDGYARWCQKYGVVAEEVRARLEQEERERT
jgi:hypothetical protein